MHRSPYLKSLATAVIALALGACSPRDKVSETQATAPVNQSRILCLARINAETNDKKAPSESTSESVDQWVRRGQAWVKHARLSADTGFYLNVDACADQALVIDAQNAPALELKALVKMNMHDFVGARALAAQLVQAHPDSFVALGLLADAQLELGEYDEALASTQAQLNLRPNMAGHARASYLRWLVGDGTGARRLILLALQDRTGGDPEAAAWTFVEAGNIYWNAGDLAGADAVYAEALTWVPGYPSALAARGKIALAQGNAQQAIEWLAQSLRARALVETAWWLGDAHAKLGDSAAAATAYAQAESIGRRGDRLMLANLLAAQKRNLPEALALIDEELKSRASIYLHDARGWILYRMGRFDEALIESDAAMRLGTPDAKLKFHAGAIRVALGQREAGVRLLQEALGLNPAFHPASVGEARELMSVESAKGMAAQ